MKNNYNYYVLLNIASYAAIGMILPLIGQYLKSILFTGAQIGTITATATAVGIFATTFWGEKYTNSHRKKLVVILLCVMASLISLSLLGIHSYYIFLVAFSILYVFLSPIMSLNDAMTIESGNAFNQIRKWGCIGFAGATFISGKVANIAGLRMIFPLGTLAYISTGLIIYKIYTIERKKNKRAAEGTAITAGEAKETAGEAKGDEKKINAKISYKEIVKNKKLMAIIISAFFLLGTNVANNTYFSFIFLEGNGTLGGVGTAFLLMAGSEAIFMGLSAKISRKIGLEKSILIAMCISVGRFLWYGTGPSSTMLLAMFFLQGAVNGIILVEFIRYIHQTVKAEELGMGISLYYAISNNLSTIICQFIGGLALDYGGGKAVYIFFGTYNIVGVLCYILFGLYKRKGKT